MEDKEESLAQGWRSLCGLCQQYLLPHFESDKVKFSIPFIAKDLSKKGTWYYWTFPLPLKLTWPCDLFWPMICEETCITSWAHIFRASVWLSILLSLLLSSWKHMRRWSFCLKHTLFRKYLEANMSCLWISHLPCDLQKWCDNVISKWWELSCWVLSSFFLTLDGGPKHKHLARQLSLLETQRNGGPEASSTERNTNSSL